MLSSEPTTPTGPYALRRLGVLMRPEPDTPQEALGVQKRLVAGVSAGSVKE